MPSLTFEDCGTLADNLVPFGAYLTSLNIVIGPIHSPVLRKVADLDYERDRLLDQLLAALVAESKEVAAAVPGTTANPASVAVAATSPARL